MEEYIPKSALVAEIEIVRAKWFGINNDFAHGQKGALTDVLSLINTLEVKEVDLDKQAEWIANGIMIAVQSAKLHTNVYNPDRKDYDHSHLMQAARRGIELGLKIVQKGE